MPRATLLNDQGQIILTNGPVELKPYEDRPFISREFMTDAEITAYAGDDLMLDSEAYPNYWMCGFKHIKSGKYIKIDGDFNPQFLSWLMFNYRTVGFNSIDYDLAMIWAAYTNRDTYFLKEVSNALIMSGERRKDIEKEFNFKVYKTPHIDLIDVCPLKGSLKLYAARLHAKRLQDLPFPDTQELTANEIDIVCNYNFNDLDLTELVFNFNKDRLDLRESIGSEYGLDLMSKSDAQMAEAVISKEVGKLLKKRLQPPVIPAGTIYKYEVPPFLMYATEPMNELLGRVRKAEFILGLNGKIIPPTILDEPVKIGGNYYSVGIGGLHSKDKQKAYVASNGKRIKDIDVTSYYPNAIINMRLIPSAMGEPFLTIYGGFKAARVHAKRNKLFTKDKGLKIFLNGVSGKFSDQFSTMYAPGNTIQMNITGQLSILMLAEMYECNGIEVISANTDGLVIYYNDDEEDKVNYWIKYWENLTGFQLEDTDYARYHARDVNAYFAVKKDAKTEKDVKVKGPYSEVGSQSGTQLDNNPVNLICSDAIKLFLMDGTPVEKTIRECRDITRFVSVRNVKGGAHKDRRYLGKVVRYAYCTGVSGTINYILTGNKVPDTDGAQPMQDLPETFPENIDYDRYISIANAILHDIAYYRKPKQIQFF